MNNLLKSLGLATASLLVLPGVLLLAEAAIRLSGSSNRSTGLEASLHSYSEVYGWEPRAGAFSEWDGRRATINAAGYRGPLAEAKRTPGRTRVVLLGDSITFGTYAEDGTTFADQLNQPAEGLEVINLAVQGYGLGQDLLRLERVGVSYEPDIVVLNVCLANDFADTVVPVFLYDGLHPKPYHTVENGRLVLHDGHVRLDTRSRLGLWLRERSRLYDRVAFARQDPAPQVEDGWTERRAAALADPQQAISVALEVIERIRATSEAAGARLVIAVHPDKAHFKSQSMWSEVFRSPRLAGVTVVDMAAGYRAHGLRFQDLALDNIGHLTPRGHRVAAAILRDRLAPIRLSLGREGAPTT